MHQSENMWIGATPGQGRRQRIGVPARHPRSAQCRQAFPSLVLFSPGMPFISHFTDYYSVVSDQIVSEKLPRPMGSMKRKYRPSGLAVEIYMKILNID
jgi:hypothetical protein